MCCWVHVWPGNYYTNLSPLEDEPPMKAPFLGTLAASQAVPIIEFITADIRAEILDSNEPTQAAAALAAQNQPARECRQCVRAANMSSNDPSVLLSRAWDRPRKFAGGSVA